MHPLSPSSAPGSQRRSDEPAPASPWQSPWALDDLAGFAQQIPARPAPAVPRPLMPSFPPPGPLHEIPAPVVTAPAPAPPYQPPAARQDPLPRPMQPSAAPVYVPVSQPAPMPVPQARSPEPPRSAPPAPAMPQGYAAPAPQPAATPAPVFPAAPAATPRAQPAPSRVIEPPPIPEHLLPPVPASRPLTPPAAPAPTTSTPSMPERAARLPAAQSWPQELRPVPLATIPPSAPSSLPGLRSPVEPEEAPRSRAPTTPAADLAVKRGRRKWRKDPVPQQEGDDSQTAIHREVSARIYQIEAEERWRRLRLAMIGALVALAAMLVAWFYLHDGDAPTDADLAAPAPVQSDNPPPAADRLKQVLDTVVGVESTATDSVGRPAWLWDTPLLSRTVTANQAALSQLKTLLAEEDWQPRHPIWMKTDYGSLPGWDSLALVKAAEVAYLNRKGSDQEAFESALEMLRLSGRLQTLNHWPTCYPRSVELHQRACELISEMLRTTKLPSYTLGQMQVQFERLGQADQLLHEALNSFYQFERRLVIGARQGDLWDMQMAAMPRPSFNRFFFKPNRTLDLFSQGFRSLKQEVASPPYSRTDPVVRLLDDNRNSHLFGSPNGDGLRHARVRLWPYAQLVERQGLQKTRHLLVLTQFAIRRYTLDKRKAPAALMDLIPVYLLEVPLDPYSSSREPLIYNAEAGTLHSLGTDSVDKNGKTGEVPLSDSQEPTVLLTGKE